jgi:hypothetical protein
MVREWYPCRSMHQSDSGSRLISALLAERN